MKAQLPNIRNVRALAKTHKLDGAIVIGFADGTFAVTSYGATKQQCKELAALVDFIADALEQQKIRLPSFDTGGIESLPFIEQDRSEYDAAQ